MRGYNASTFQLSSKTKKILSEFCSSHSLPASLVLRSKIVLLASEGKSNPQITAEIGASYTTVGTWKKHFFNNTELISRVEKCMESGGSPLELENVIKSILSDRQQSEKQLVFTPKQIQLINELACKNPKDFGWRLRRWNPPALAAEAARQGIVKFISPASFQRFLKPATH